METPTTSQARTEKLGLVIGDVGIAKLANTCVMVIGIGGVGSNCAEALARGGIGSFILVDNDSVSASNINRQAIAYTSTVGQDKVEVMKRLILDINPDATVVTDKTFVLPDTIEELFAKGTPDVVLDCQDTVTAKIALAQWCDEHAIELVSAMGIGNKLNPFSLEFADISKTQVCPMCRTLRKECRKRGIKKMRVLYSTERPLAVPLEEGSRRGDRSNIGSMSYMPPIMGQMLAADCICTLLGIDYQERS